MNNLGILLSGRGSNFEAIADNVASGKLDANIAIVISNRPDAPGIESAQRRGLKALVIPSKGVAARSARPLVVAALADHKVDLVCLAGYMRLLSPWFVQQFPNRILNIHPSLLPAFPGLEAQKQAFDYGVKVSGCTVHFVDADLDHGAIILQKTVPVLDTDDDHSSGCAHPGAGARCLQRGDRNRAEGQVHNQRAASGHVKMTMVTRIWS